MKYSFLIFVVFLSVTFSNASGCDRTDAEGIDTNTNMEGNNNGTMEAIKIRIKVGSNDFSITLLDNSSTEAFIEMLPMTIDMTELNGNEKYYDLPEDLPTNSSNPGTIRNGDLMLYGNNTLVLFYKTFTTPYSYTPLGRIEDPSGLASALGPGNVRVIFEMN